MRQMQSQHRCICRCMIEGEGAKPKANGVAAVGRPVTGVSHMQGVCYLVAPNGTLDLLPVPSDPWEVFGQGPLHRVQLRHGWELLWSSAGYQFAEVNELASCLAREHVKGDACLVNRRPDAAADNQALLKHWPGMHRNTPKYAFDAWAEALRPQQTRSHAPGSSSCSSTTTSHRNSAPGGAAGGCRRAARSLHIRAAHAAHARILARRQSAGADCGPGPSSPTENSSSSSLVAAASWTSPHNSSAHQPSSNAAQVQVQGQGVQSIGDTSAAHAAAVAGRHGLTDCIQPLEVAPGNAAAAGGSIQEDSSGRCINNHFNSFCSLPAAAGTMDTVLPALATGLVPDDQAAAGGAAAAAHGFDLPPSRATSAAAHNVMLPLQDEQRAAAGAGSLCSACSSSDDSSVVLPSHCPSAATPVAAAASTTAAHDVAAHAASVPPAMCFMVGPESVPQPGNGSSAVLTKQVDNSSSSSGPCKDQEDEVDLWASSWAPWDQLPVEVLGVVASYLGPSAAGVLPLYASSRCWQDAILGDDSLLRTLTFTLDAKHPVTSQHPRSGRLLCSWLKSVADLPRLLLKAKQVHNVSATACCAQLLEVAGAHDQAMSCWQRCAKAGHLEGQLRYGLALYRGTAGVVQDADSAFMYLNRAMKQVLAVKSEATGSTQSSGDAGLLAAGNSPAAGVPAAVSSAVTGAPAAAAATEAPGTSSAVDQCKQRRQQQLVTEVLCQAGAVLGYLHFDGEGTRSDREEATRFFKLASEHGNKEAEQVLGWIFNTGQYG